ncbi:hypothetical protein D1871_22130 [Nakamurella silvestris]|nr:hypothetical protein D1871_22130 [Nakamurella silvestris]
MRLDADESLDGVVDLLPSILPPISAEEPPFLQHHAGDVLVEQFGHVQTATAVHRFVDVDGGTPTRRRQFAEALAGLNLGALEDRTGAQIRASSTALLVSAPTRSRLDDLTSTILLAASSTGITATIPARRQVALFRRYLSVAPERAEIAGS